MSGVVSNPRQVYLSYSRPDHERVQQLARLIRDSGFSELGSSFELVAGEHWWDTILKQIEVCDVIVPVLSPAFVESAACRRECEYAEALNKPVLPVLIERVAVALIPTYIVEHQWIVMDEPDSSSLLARALASLPRWTAPDVLPRRPEVPVARDPSLAVDHKSEEVIPERSAPAIGSVPQTAEGGSRSSLPAPFPACKIEGHFAFVSYAHSDSAAGLSRTREVAVPRSAHLVRRGHRARIGVVRGDRKRVNRR